MARIEIKQEIDIYELDGKDVSGIDSPTLGVNAHWNNDNFVVLRMGSKEYTVVGEDLKTAVDNATNSG